ncbi:hypothetical protein BU15DRAFT_59512 [Melanogaster broomeanus]|nr:hypothetical protein BU15DRAFT_59512 [Melanogaster broomeanus]
MTALAFGSEVNLIWTKEWNLVTLLYAVASPISQFPVINHTGNFARNLLELTLLLSDGIFYTSDVNWTAQPQMSFGVRRFRIPDAFFLSPSPFMHASKWVLIVVVISCIAKHVSAITLLMLAVGPSSQITYSSAALEFNFAGTFVCGTMVTNINLMSKEIPLFIFELLVTLESIAGNTTGERSDGSNVTATALNIGNWNSESVTFIPFCFSPRLVINVKQRDNRVHMSVFECGFLDNNTPDHRAQNIPSLG